MKGFYLLIFLLFIIPTIISLKTTRNIYRKLDELSKEEDEDLLK